MYGDRSSSQLPGLSSIVVSKALRSRANADQGKGRFLELGVLRRRSLTETSVQTSCRHIAHGRLEKASATFVRAHDLCSSTRLVY